MTTFNELGLQQQLLDAIALLGFENPTKIQEQAIPQILNTNEDLIALAQTGTGKTGAFGLPALQKINPDLAKVQLLILSPTRELAIQIAKDLKAYAKFQKNITTVAVYGGSEIRTQIKAIENGAQVIIGTPGRTLDLIRRRKLDVTNIKTVVLDEADEMLNMGFQEDLDQILADTPADKQTLLFSATMPKAIAKIAKKYMTNPANIEVGERNSGAKNVEHHYYTVQARDRFEALKRLVDMLPDIYGIIFCRTRNETSDIANKLKKEGYDVDLLNGDLSQNQRDDVMKRFRTKELQLLVATDVAARGLDVDNLTHVINYNLPDDLEVYIHRSGRTGRAGNSGISISIIHTRESRKIQNLERMSGKDFIEKKIPSGEEICGIRMLDLIDTVTSTEVNEERIAPFVPAAMEKLSELDREELIKHFLSVEFNRFLEYYKNAPDLNAKGKSRSGRKERGSKSRGNDNNYERFFINIGKRDGLNPVRLMGVINEVLKGEKPDFGKIDVDLNFSFFEVEPGFGNAMIKSVKGIKFEGRPVSIEESKGGSRNKKRGGGNRSKRKRR
ncbi:MAG: DEAD/DEAH box helicase [Balneolaceae bacterium]|nr:DEAD/DEAH box helicase [Balneolaceae bacterium]